MKDLIIFSGAPGSGKTIIAGLLQKETKSPLIDFGDLRAWHLNFDWSNANAEEEEMAFENLLFILKNYLKHKYKNILITDLKDDRVTKLAEHFLDYDVLVVSLVVSKEEELKKRILEPRESGFNNIEEALIRNKKIMDRKQLSGELRVDNSHNEPSKTVLEIMKAL